MALSTSCFTPRRDNVLFLEDFKLDLPAVAALLTLVGYSRMSVVALEVARRLEQEQGISCEVIDVRSLRPLDRPTLIESVKKTSRCVVIEEDQ